MLIDLEHRGRAVAWSAGCLGCDPVESKARELECRYERVNDVDGISSETYWSIVSGSKLPRDRLASAMNLFTRPSTMRRTGDMLTISHALKAHRCSTGRNIASHFWRYVQRFRSMTQRAQWPTPRAIPGMIRYTALRPRRSLSVFGAIALQTDIEKLLQEWAVNNRRQVNLEGLKNAAAEISEVLRAL
jgi:hypothetical protein